MCCFIDVKIVAEIVYSVDYNTQESSFNMDMDCFKFYSYCIGYILCIGSSLCVLLSGHYSSSSYYYYLIKSVFLTYYPSFLLLTRGKMVWFVNEIQHRALSVCCFCWITVSVVVRVQGFSNKKFALLFRKGYFLVFSVENGYFRSFPCELKK